MLYTGIFTWNTEEPLGRTDGVRDTWSEDSHEKPVTPDKHREWRQHTHTQTHTHTHSQALCDKSQVNPLIGSREGGGGVGTKAYNEGGGGVLRLTIGWELS